MKKVFEALQVVAVTLWVGGLWAIGYIVAPLMFNTLSNRAFAGMLTGRMFLAIAYVGMICGGYLLLTRFFQAKFSVFKQGVFWLIALMVGISFLNYSLLEALLYTNQFKQTQWSMMDPVWGNRLPITWHMLATLIYLVQSGLGLVLVLKLKK